ncbi:MAG: endonuclease/exonuclease/phosphatase family protein [Bacteroidales bacterium]
MQKIIIILASLFFTACVSAQKYEPKKTVTAAFYNVENLYDTVNDPAIKDEEFLPTSPKKWNSERYFKKLEDLSKVISSINTKELPEIVGFAEIENRSVLEDLVKTKELKAANYQIIHKDSPDSRGIDVGLIYRPDEFNYLSHHFIPFSADFAIEYKLRDILYVKGLLDKNDTIHVFINHWKSRSGSEKETENQRITQSQNLRDVVDSLLTTNQQAKIVIMGDLNDEPRNTSVFETLKANNDLSDNKNLVNLMLPLVDAGKGSHSFRGDWTMLDNIIVSQSLTGKNGFIVQNNEAFIFDAEWITYTNNKGEKSPNRTFGGLNYYGGYSDHYPVYVTFIKK